MQRTSYYKFPDGTLSERTTDSHGVVVDPTPPAGAVAISATAYRTLMAEMARTIDLLTASLRDGEQRRAREDFEALTALGVPELTARRLSGYRALDGGTAP